MVQVVVFFNVLACFKVCVFVDSYGKMIPDYPPEILHRYPLNS